MTILTNFIIAILHMNYFFITIQDPFNINWYYSSLLQLHPHYFPHNYINIHLQHSIMPADSSHYWHLRM